MELKGGTKLCSQRHQTRQAGVYSAVPRGQNGKSWLRVCAGSLWAGDLEKSIQEIGCPNPTDREGNKMRLKSALMGIAVTLAFAVFSPTIARADLLGSEVTGVLLSPDETTFSSGPIGPVPVTSGVEFPVGTLALDGSLDVSGAQIIWTATLPETYHASAFNGFI
jgi:hypothetical protein